MRTFWVFAIFAALVFNAVITAGSIFNLTERFVSACLLESNTNGSSFHYPKYRRAGD